MHSNVSVGGSASFSVLSPGHSFRDFCLYTILPVIPAYRQQRRVTAAPLGLWIFFTWQHGPVRLSRGQGPLPPNDPLLHEPDLLRRPPRLLILRVRLPLHAPQLQLVEAPREQQPDTVRRDVRPLEGRQSEHEADLRAEVRGGGVQETDHACELVAFYAVSCLVEHGVQHIVAVGADTGLEPGVEVRGGGVGPKANPVPDLGKWEGGLKECFAMKLRLKQT